MVPQARIGLAQLTKLAFAGTDLSPLRGELLKQCVRDGGSEGVLMDLSAIDQLCGQREAGLAWQSKALETCQAFQPLGNETAQKTVLVYAATTDIGGNTPVEFLLEGSDFKPVFYYPSQATNRAHTLPAHDVAFCAAPSDAVDAPGFLKTVQQLTVASGVKTLNLPQEPLSLDRLALEHLLADVDGLRVPQTQALTRAGLEKLWKTAETKDFAAPFLVRPVGSHAGEGLRNISSRDALTVYLREREEGDFYLSEFVDYASNSDGQYRKYRIVFVAGQAFPCHMAIADRWDVWYLNAGMHMCPHKRQEEAFFMDGFADGFANRHNDALQAIASRIGLDYFGIDCAEDREGNLLVFEADNALIVHDMDPRTTFPYKHKHMKAIFSAFEQLLLANCGNAAVLPGQAN